MLERPVLLPQIVAFLNDGRAVEAERLCREWLATDPDDGAVLVLLGEARRRQGDAAEAERLLRQAASQPAHRAPASFRLGLVYRDLGRRAEAAAVFAQAVEADPGLAEAWLALLAEHHALGDTAGAMAACRGQIAHHPNDWRPRYNLGALLLAAGAPAEAVPVLRGQLALAPESWQGWLNLGAAWERLGRPAESASALLRAWRLSPERADLLRLAAQRLIDAGDMAAAAAALRRQLALQPLDWQARDLLCLLLLDQGRIAEATAESRRAVSLHPSQPELLSHYAMVEKRLGRFEVAAGWLRRGLRLVPGDDEMISGLASCYYEENRLDEAEALLGPEDLPKRSAVIAVLDYSPGGPYNIRTLLDDLKDFDGEVVCVFNGDEVFRDLRDHPRIDKFSYNKHNVGVARAWNIGLNLAEGEVVFILNADLQVTPAALATLDQALRTLPDAAVVGVSGDLLDHDTAGVREHIPSADLTGPRVVDQVSGYFFALHAQRCHDAGISFDPRLSPYFYEETDLGAKVRAAGWQVYAVPTEGFHHVLGISRRNRPIYFFGRPVNRIRSLVHNKRLMQRRLAKERACDAS